MKNLINPRSTTTTNKITSGNLRYIWFACAVVFFVTISYLAYKLDNTESISEIQQGSEGRSEQIAPIEARSLSEYEVTERTPLTNDSVNLPAPDKQTSSSTSREQSDENLSTPFPYDRSIGLDANLRRLFDYLETHGDSDEVAATILGFISEMHRHSSGQERVFIAALQARQGNSLYRKVLLAGLSGSSGDEAGDAIWTVAVDPAEAIDVREVASFLLAEIPHQSPRPELLNELLASEDPRIRLFALQAAVNHANVESIDMIESLAIHDTDLHVRVAAISALPHFSPDRSQSFLLEISQFMRSEAEDPFSDEAIIKSAVVANLDAKIAMDELQALAYDSKESERVRSQAVMQLGRVPEGEEILRSLLIEVGEQESFLLYSIFEAASLNFIESMRLDLEDRISAIEDPELKKIFENIINKQ